MTNLGASKCNLGFRLWSNFPIYQHCEIKLLTFYIISRKTLSFSFLKRIAKITSVSRLETMEEESNPRSYVRRMESMELKVLISVTFLKAQDVEKRG